MIDVKKEGATEAARVQPGEKPGISADGRLWWEQSSVYWELPFFTEMGFTPLPERDEMLAAREQLWAMRELPEDAMMVDLPQFEMEL